MAPSPPAVEFKTTSDFDLVWLQVDLNRLKIIDREFVTSAKKFANFNEFSEIKKIVKIRKKFVKCPSGRGRPTSTEEYDAFHGFMLIKI